MDVAFHTSEDSYEETCVDQKYGGFTLECLCPQNYIEGVNISTIMLMKQYICTLMGNLYV